MQCMQPNFLLTGQVYPMLMSSVPHALGNTRQKKCPFQIDCKIFLKGVGFMFRHDIVYIELLYCVTNFEVVWTWIKVAVVENACFGMILLRSEIPSSKCAKLRTVAASNNRDHPTRSLYYCLFAPYTCIFVLRAHLVRGESHNQRNTTGEFATILCT